MKKNDWIILLLILIISGITFLVFGIFYRQPAAMVKVTVDGEVYGMYSLKKEQRITINKTNSFVIKDNEVDMIEGNCPDKICVEHRNISKNTESIVCLPNRIIIEIVGGEAFELDAITK
jgi:hypothetical protein